MGFLFNGLTVLGDLLPGIEAKLRSYAIDNNLEPKARTTELIRVHISRGIFFKAIVIIHNIDISGLSI